MAITTTLKTLREAVAGQLNLVVLTAINDLIDSTSFEIDELTDFSADSERWRDAYVYQGGLVGRVVSYDDATGVVTIARPSIFTEDPVQVYFMLHPKEFSNAINEAIQELYYVEREAITLVADTKVYDLPTWCQQKGQILDLRWRDVSVAATDPYEEPVASYRLIEDANAMTVYINDKLRDVTTWELVVVGRRNYSTFTSDSATTTCPYKLIFGVALARVIQRLFQKYGKGIASLYGQKLVLAERDELKLKSDWLPKLAAREIVDDEYWEGPDIPYTFAAPRW